ADVWRLEIPKGSYVPFIHPLPAKETELPVAPASVLPKWSVALMGGLAFFALAGWVLAAWLFSSRPAQARNAFALKSILADRTKPAMVVLDDPILSMAWNQLGEQKSLDEFI